MMAIVMSFALFLGNATDLQARIEETVRETLASHCGAQCEVAGVETEMGEREAKMGTAAPGFVVGPTSAARFLRRVKVRVAYDANVAKEFRAQVAKLLELRVRRVSGEPSVKLAMNETTFAFPRPLPAPPAATAHPAVGDATRAAAGSTPAPQFIPVPQYIPMPFPQRDARARDEAPEKPRATAEAVRPAAEPRSVDRLVEEKLVESIPLFAALLVAVVIAALLAHALSRRGASSRVSGNIESSAPNSRPPALQVAADDAGADLALLRAELAAKPRSRDALVRSLLDERAVDQLARFTQLFGAESLNGQRDRSDRREVIAAVGDRLASLRAPSAVEVAELVYGFRTRLTRLSLVASEEAARDLAAFVDAPAEVAAAVLRALPQADQVEVLARLPAHVRASYVAALEPHKERDLLRALLGRESRGTISEAGLRDLDRRIADIVKVTEARITREHDEVAMIEEIIETRDIDEARPVIELLVEQRPDLAEKLLARVPLDGAAVLADEEALANALLAVDPSQLRDYLANVQPTERRRWVAACPARLRERLAADVERLAAERLAEGSPPNAENLRCGEARRAVTRSLGGALRNEGVSIAEINRAILHGDAAALREEAQA